MVSGRPGRPAASVSYPAEDGLSSREALLETALQFFSERGFKGTSIRDIANALEISVSNIYHYFGSKEGLWLAIMEYSVKSLPLRLENSLLAITDPLERLHALVMAHLTVSASQQRELKMIMLDHDRMSAAGVQANLDIQRRVLAIYIRELEALRQGGLISTGNVRILAFNILAVINWQLRWFRPDGPLSAAEVHAEIVKFIFHGLSGK